VTASLRDVAFALDAPGAEPWSLNTSLSLGLWPPLSKGPGVSVLELTRRLGRAGAELRKVAAGGAHGWTHMHRDVIVSELRDRLRDPAIVRQKPTDLCGPFAVLVELGRREPWRYVRAAGQLLDEGTLSITGVVIEADAELRAKPLPPKSVFADWSPGEVDWMITTTMREAENVFEDIDDAEGVEAMTLPGAMEQWTRDLLGLKSHLFECYHEDELEAMQVARHAVDAGGVAFLLVDANLIKDGEDDDEEEMRWRAAEHLRREPVGAPGELTHSEDDAWPPDHWVLYLGGLKPKNPSGGDTITLKLWSWGKEFTMTGTAEAFGEYLYAVVAGTP
jgi:hypothetical protein